MDRNFKPGLDFAVGLDKQDPLRNFRNRFYINEIYMDGNSLGLCSKDAEQSALSMLEAWKKYGIGIWGAENSKYFLYPSFLGALTAPLIGANANEVTVTNSTTINIHQAVSTFYKPTAKRYRILTDSLNFPTDRYALESQIRLRGYDPADALKVVQSKDGRTISEDCVIEAMTDDVALVLLPSVLYRSAQLLDMERITAAARSRGVVVGWDLCHSIGSVPHDFKKLKPDFAVWCSYKYLSGGPGATAGLYINSRHFDTEPGLAGWYGNVKSTQFKLKDSYEHSNDADGWLTGTSPLLSMAPLEGALRLYGEAGIERIREKSLKITAYLMYLIDSRLAAHGFAIGTPREDEKRGGHVALEHKDAYRICKAMKNRGVIPDFREPNVIRLAPAALYVSYEDAYRCIDIIEGIYTEGEYEKYDEARSLVV